MDEHQSSHTALIGQYPISRDVASLTLLCACVIAFAGEMVWDDKVPFFRDLNNYFYPLRYSLAEAFAKGEVPLWNRHMAMGFPLLADIQTGTFYPPHLLFRVLSFFDAVRVCFVSHYFTAASGAYFLCRHWGLDRYQALIGALLFFLGGTTVSMINLLNHFQSAVWLPWAMLFWEKLLGQLSWGRFIIFVLVLVCQLLAGSPEIFAMSAALIWLRGLCVAVGNPARKLAQVTIWLAAANLTAIVLGAVQILPTAELILSSRRQEGIPFIEAAGWSLHPWTLLNLLFLDKRIDMGLGDATQMFFGRDIPFFVSYYFGAIFVPCLFVWLWLAASKERIFLGALILGSLVLAFGRYTPVYPFLYDHVAIFRSFRFPEKLFFLTQALVLVAAIRGLHFCLKSHDRHVGWLAFGFYAGLLSVVYLLVRSNPEALWNFVVQQKAVPVPLQYSISNTAASLVSLERQLGFAFVLLALFLLCKMKYLNEGLFNTLLVGVVFCDLAWAHQPFQYLLKPQTILHKPKVVEAKVGSPSRVFYYPQGRNLHPSTFLIRKPVTTPFSEIATTVASNLLPNFGLFYGIDYLQDINALAKDSYIEFLRYANPLAPEDQIRLLAALNVRHVISFKALDVANLTLIRHFPEHPSFLYEVDGVVPRTYVVQGNQIETTPKQMMAQFTKPGFDSSKTVFVDHVIPINASDNFTARSEIVNYGNRSVVLRSISNGPGVLVLADSYFPGWRVFVDGMEDKLLRTNYFFRGVAIPAGEHRVEFRYEPMSFTIGLWISLAMTTALAVVSLILLARTRRRIADIRSRKELAPAVVT